MTPKKYITQLSQNDMKELAAVTNLEAGFLIRIDRDQDKIKISVDQTALALALNGFFRNGGMQTYAENCTNIPFDPPS
jgi:hypothetical protein